MTERLTEPLLKIKLFTPQVRTGDEFAADYDRLAHEYRCFTLFDTNRLFC